MEWKVKEVMNHILGKFPAKKVAEFLNTLPEERASEVKICMMSNAPLVYIYYRE